MGLARKLAAALAAFVLLAGADAVAQVPSPFARQLAGQLAHAEPGVREQGFMFVAGPFAGALAQQRARQININLRAGQEYRFVGACDTNCGDIDLRLFDPNGQLVAEDTAGNTTPMLRVRATTTGPHRVEVAMYKCEAAECWYAFNVYARWTARPQP
ncbi:MAG: hypothetical protein QM759_17000 [Terricaulis sp.]